MSEWVYGKHVRSGQLDGDGWLLQGPTSRILTTRLPPCASSGGAPLSASRAAQRASATDCRASQLAAPLVGGAMSDRTTLYLPPAHLHHHTHLAAGSTA